MNLCCAHTKKNKRIKMKFDVICMDLNCCMHNEMRLMIMTIDNHRIIIKYNELQ